MIRVPRWGFVAALVGLVASTLLLAGCVVGTTTALSASAPSTVSGQAVTFTARVAAATTPTGTVTFREGAAILGSAALTGGTASFTTTTLSVGNHQIYANYAAQGTWATSSSAAVTVTVVAANATVINTHPLAVDGGGKIVPWNSGGSDAYDGVVRNSWNYLLNSVPTAPNGLKAYFSYSFLDPDTQAPASSPHDPGSLYSMLTESAIEWYRYSGDSAPLNLAQTLLNYQLANGMTASTDNWPSVSYASADAGATTYRGASRGDQTGIGDGTGVVEPDKVGEQGLAFLQMYEQTGNTTYRDTAINAANVLATHVRAGDATHSPWPFRVVAATGAVRDEYSAHTVSAIELFDELTRLGLGNTASYLAARTTAWNWTFAYPYQNQKWDGYFEDIENKTTQYNPNQLNPMMFARYLLQHPDRDPNWEAHVRSLIAYVETTFAVSASGANTIKEQGDLMVPMGSHTSRYASVNALLYARTGDVAAKEKAYRSFNWATYMDRSNGVNIDSPDIGDEWFTDGYGDYIRHFMTGMAAVPEWAPTGQDHLLDATTTVTSITYAPGRIDYRTFDNAGTETLKLAFAPASVTVGGVALGQSSGGDGWTYNAATSVLTVRHSAGNHILVT